MPGDGPQRQIDSEQPDRASSTLELDSRDLLSANVKQMQAPVEDKMAKARAIDLDNLFMHHPPKGDQAERYQRIREAGKHLAAVSGGCGPPSADATVAVRKVREAVMNANAAIACNE